MISISQFEPPPKKDSLPFGCCCGIDVEFTAKPLRSQSKKGGNKEKLGLLCGFAVHSGTVTTHNTQRGYHQKKEPA